MLFFQAFPASLELFAGPLGDISIRIFICECLSGFFFPIVVLLYVRPFVLNNIGVFLNTGQQNLIFRDKASKLFLLP